MRKRGPMVALLVMLAAALLAAGCGSDDSSTTSGEAATTSEATDTSTTDVGSVDSESVYNACIDAIPGGAVAAEAIGKPLCEQARTAFEACAEQADAATDESARANVLAACQAAAEQATAALQPSG